MELGAVFRQAGRSLKALNSLRRNSHPVLLQLFPEIALHANNLLSFIRLVYEIAVTLL